MIQQKVILVALLLLSFQASKALTVTGTVYNDINKNGIRDVSEKGLRNVPVSNGEEIVVTNKSGNYLIKALPGNSVFPVTSSGFVLSNPHLKVQNSGFCYISPIDSSSENVVADFALKAVPHQKNFRMAAVGDVQVDNYQEIKYTNQTFISEMMRRNDIDFNLFLGDLVNDKPNFLPVVKDMLNQLPTHSWTVFGNHDRKTKTDLPQDIAYNQSFGASSYAFNYGDVHFLIINNIMPKGKTGYEGGLSEKQLKFIANDLKFVPNEKLVVVSMHIPLDNTTNKDSLLRLLENHRQLFFITAHMHTTGRVFHKDNKGRVIPELVAGAPCGAWWTGERDASGTPSGLMQCGSPRNYYILDFRKNKYNLKFKGIGLDESSQMDIWVSGQDTLDAHVPALAELPSNTIITNVFGGSDSTTVTLIVDDLQPVLMEKVSKVSPNVSRIAAMNKDEVYPTSYSRKAALRKTPSPHIWKAVLPENLMKGAHSIRISAKDSFGFEASGATTIQL